RHHCKRIVCGQICWNFALEAMRLVRAWWPLRVRLICGSSTAALRYQSGHCQHLAIDQDLTIRLINSLDDRVARLDVDAARPHRKIRCTNGRPFAWTGRCALLPRLAGKQSPTSKPGFGGRALLHLRPTHLMSGAGLPRARSLHFAPPMTTTKTLGCA